jgi:hypothetical protein
LQVRRQISLASPTAVANFQILFQGVLLGRAIWKFFFGIEWYLDFYTGVMYLGSFGFLLWEGVDLFSTWKRSSRRNNQEFIL